MVCSMADVFQCFLQNGRIEVGLLGGAQIDRYGNINTTVVGDYASPDRASARAAAAPRRSRSTPDAPWSSAGSTGGRSPSRWTSSPAPATGCRAGAGASWECPARDRPGSSPTRPCWRPTRTPASWCSPRSIPGVTAAEVAAGVGWPLRSRATARARWSLRARASFTLLREVLDPQAALPQEVDQCAGQRATASARRRGRSELPRVMTLRDLVLFNIVADPEPPVDRHGSGRGPQLAHVCGCWPRCSSSCPRDSPSAISRRAIPRRAGSTSGPSDRSGRGTASSAAGATGSTTSCTIPTC